MESQIQVRLLALDKCLRNKYKMHSMTELVNACNKVLENKGYTKVSERTVREDMKNIQMEYDAEIEKKLDGHTALYRYIDTDFTIATKIFPEGVKSAIQETINVIDNLGDSPYVDWIKNVLGQLLIDSPSDNAGNVQFQSNPDLTGIKYFKDLMGYIINKRPIELTYQAYGKDKQTFVMHPYLLKQYNDRWFLIGRNDGYDSLTVRSIDRITAIKESTAEFVASDIDFEEYFDSVIGVTMEPDAPVEDIVLKIDPKRYNYIKTKPIHNSQTELHELSDDKHKYVRLKLRINRELTAMLLSFGRDVEVIQPASLRDWMRQQAMDMLEAYR